MTNSYHPINATRAVANQYTIMHDVETRKVETFPRSYLEFHELDEEANIDRLKTLGDAIGNLILDTMGDRLPLYDFQ